MREMILIEMVHFFTNKNLTEYVVELSVNELSNG